MKRLILLFWFILLFLYSCQSKKGDGSFLPLTELQPLTLGMMPTLDGLPFHIAKTQGIYDSLGLNLTILSFNSANDRDAAFQTGKMDGMITDYPSAVVLQAIHHADLGLVLKNDGYFCFIVSKESNINQLEQLKEKEYSCVTQHSYRICYRPVIKQSQNQSFGNEYTGNRPASSPTANVAVQSD